MCLSLIVVVVSKGEEHVLRIARSRDKINVVFIVICRRFTMWGVLMVVCTVCKQPGIFVIFTSVFDILVMLNSSEWINRQALLVNI